MQSVHSSVTAVERLIRPRSVAIVGASSDPSRTTGRPLRYLLKHRYGGTIYPVNPRAAEIEGIRCYPNIAALPEPPDMALVLVAPELVEDAVRQLAALGTPAAIVLAGGYAEADEAGRQRQAELKVAAGPMRLLGPNTIGLVNVTDNTALTPSVALELAPLAPGSVGLVSQSGGILGSVLSRAEARGIGFSRLVSTGNEADLQVEDIVEFLLDDDATRVIALYLEGLRDVPRFRRLAQRAWEIGKPLVAFKVGRSEAGARSASSHTGAMAGSDRVYDAMFSQHGILRAATFADLIDVAGALATERRPRGNRLAVLTSTGGAGVLVADACGVVGFESPPPDAGTVARLVELLPGEAAMAERNPVDVTLAGLRSDLFKSAIAALLASPTYDALVTIVGSSGIAQPELAAGPVLDCLRETDKPILVYVSPYAPNIIQYLNRHGVPAFDTPEGCAAALAALRHGTAGTPVPGADTTIPHQGNRATPSDMLAGLTAGPLNEAEAKALFRAAGIPSVRERIARTPDEAEAAARDLAGPGGSVVLKVLSRDLAHKTEAGGVRVGVPVADVAAEATDLLVTVRERQPRARTDGVLVQEQILGGVELILGFTRDPQIGPAILVGAGGVAAELYGDTVVRLPPISGPEARQMVARLTCYPLLTGYRGRHVADVRALAQAVVAFSELVESLGNRLVEAEINPLFVLPEGQGVLAADGLAVLAPA
ncbi:MAG: acetate--CoA ligase family protein [Chloroflexi bacterium]|nr:acetate--CoA ligase family protein [Chloroflexota bacterium]